MAIYCCKDCVAPKRHPGCHGHCQEYDEQKAKHDEEKEAERKKRQISYGITAQRSVSVTRALRERRNHDGN